jgi:hypothetical protein
MERMREGIAAAVATVLLALWVVVPTAALAQPPTTETIKQTLSTTEHEPFCSGAAVPIHITGKTVFHITEFDDGRYHITGIAVGRITVTDAGVTYTGRLTTPFRENSNTKSFNFGFSFSATAKGSDGSKARLHAVVHITVNANGELTTEVGRSTTICG